MDVSQPSPPPAAPPPPTPPRSEPIPVRRGAAGGEPAPGGAAAQADDAMPAVRRRAQAISAEAFLQRLQVSEPWIASGDAEAGSPDLSPTDSGSLASRSPYETANEEFISPVRIALDSPDRCVSSPKSDNATQPPSPLSLVQPLSGSTAATSSSLLEPLADLSLTQSPKTALAPETEGRDTAVPFDPLDTSPLLVLDTRARPSFEGHLQERGTTGHVRGAVHIQLPTLLLRRHQRMQGRALPLAAMDSSLLSYISSTAGMCRLSQVLNVCRAHRTDNPEVSPSTVAPAPSLADVFWLADIVVLFEESPQQQRADSSAFAGRMLLHLLENIAQDDNTHARHPPAPRGLYYVRGGLRAVRSVPGSKRFFEQGEPGLPPGFTAHEAAMAASPSAERPSAQAPGRLSLSCEPIALPSPQLGAPAGLSRQSSVQRPSLPRLDMTSVLAGENAPIRRASPSPRVSAAGVSFTRPGSPMQRIAATAPNSPSEPETVDFEVSTILPGVLYLGSSVQEPAHVARLKALGIRSILNTAEEIHDEGDGPLSLRAQFPHYQRIPMLDTVEASGVQNWIATACDFLERASLQSSPAYVHCRAGKSRSAMVVMAFLIRTKRWTLQRAYAHVAACREQISPNIGFIAELMHFEQRETELRGRLSAGNIQEAAESGMSRSTSAYLGCEDAARASGDPAPFRAELCTSPEETADARTPSSTFASRRGSTL